MVRRETGSPAAPVSSLPQNLDRARHVELRGRTRQPVFRRLAIALLAVVPVLALANVFGQDASTSTARGAQAELAVEAPVSLRGGLFFQGRVRIRATQPLHQPTLALSRGWTEQMQINTIEPAPDSETSRGGRLILTFGALPRGEELTVWMQFEVNPTGAGRRDQSVVLLDGTTPVAHITRHVTVFP